MAEWQKRGTRSQAHPHAKDLHVPPRQPSAAPRLLLLILKHAPDRRGWQRRVAAEQWAWRWGWRVYNHRMRAVVRQGGHSMQPTDDCAVHPATQTLTQSHSSLAC